MNKFKGLVLLSYCVAMGARALTADDLQYEVGAEPANDSATGKPSTMFAVAVPSTLEDEIYSMVPEGVAVNEDYIASDIDSSISIDETLVGVSYAEATITFLNEGAGFTNSLGYFVYDTDNPPATRDDIDAHVIVLPNASKPGAGEMTEGDSISLSVQLQAGQTLGFFVIPNGWNVNDQQVSSLGPWNRPFYSLSDLNPELTPEHRRHNVAFYDTDNELVIIGFEDLYRPNGDNDFNDLLFSVDVTPFSAIDGVEDDGSLGDNLEPLVLVEPEPLTTTVYPQTGKYATMAFEDRWPLMGDYDFNDVVWRYQLTETHNSEQAVKKITAEYTLQAMGAGYSNGFAIHLPGVSTSNVAALSVTRNGVAVEHTALSTGGETIITISENLRADLSALGQLTSSCNYYRTEQSCLSTQTADVLTYQLEIEFTNLVERSVLGSAPYDAFIFSSVGEMRGGLSASAPGTAWQTHFKAHSGTSDFDVGLLNTADDASGSGQYFLTDNNMPWAFNLRDEWDHPTEKTDISHAYLSFVDWVEANGADHTDWYTQSESGKVVPATGTTE